MHKLSYGSRSSVPDTAFLDIVYGALGWNPNRKENQVVGSLCARYWGPSRACAAATIGRYVLRIRHSIIGAISACCTSCDSAGFRRGLGSPNPKPLLPPRRGPWLTARLYLEASSRAARTAGMLRPLGF